MLLLEMAAAASVPDLTHMWSQLKNTTECHGRMVAYEYSLQIMPDDKAPLREAFDALELFAMCGVQPPSSSMSRSRPPRARAADGHSPSISVYVDPVHGSDKSTSGTLTAPVLTMGRGLALLRSKVKAANHAKKGKLVLRAGTHFLDATLQLSAADSGTTFEAYNGEEAWVSGGRLLQPKWEKHGSGSSSSSSSSNSNNNDNIYVTDVPAEITKIPGLATMGGTTGHRRLWRARHPNGDPELCTGDCWADASAIKSWHTDLSCIGKAEVVYKDLRECDPKSPGGKFLPDGTPCKDDSAMWDSYNTYNNGHGGCCAPWGGDQSPLGPQGNYFCGRKSAGGWVGFDDPRGQNDTQGLSPPLPYGFTYDTSKVPELKGFGDSLEGAVIHVWRAQGWAVHMFEILEHDSDAASATFARVGEGGKTGHVKGGWQGGRGWQVGNASAINETQGNYLTAGGWRLENVLAALDEPNEFFFDEKNHKLYYWPNVTSGPPPADVQLVAANLQTLINVTATMANPAKDIVIDGLKFRDAADVIMEPWFVPSGGDWALYRGAAVFFEGCEGCQVTNSEFKRVDNNAIFLSGYTRNVSITDNDFSWLGLSAIAASGYTKEEDGTGGQQPRFTQVLRNQVREIGIIEKQSSMWFQAKSCENVVRNNLAFNQPRAAINLNGA